MKPIYIDLPLGDVIECQSLLQAISNATHPPLDKTNGIGCLIGKIAPLPTDMLNFGFPVGLNDKDRADFMPLLADLPDLHGDMTDFEIDTFLYCYSILPNRLAWLPRLMRRVDPYDLFSLKSDCWANHRKELQNRLNEGKIQAFDDGHFSVKQIGIGVYIPRAQAIEYLNECGIKTKPSNLPNDSIAKESSEEEKTVTNAESNTVNAEKNEIKSLRKSNKGTQVPWNIEKLKFLNIYINQYGIKAAAVEYGITVRRIRQLIEKYEKLNNEPFNIYSSLMRR